MGSQREGILSPQSWGEYGMTWTPGSSEAALLAESLSLASIQIWGGVCSMCTVLSLFFRMSLVAYRTGNTAGPQQEPTGYVHVYPYAHIKKGIMVSVCEGGSLSNLPHPPPPPAPRAPSSYFLKARCLEEFSTRNSLDRFFLPSRMSQTFSLVSPPLPVSMTIS